MQYLGILVLYHLLGSEELNGFLMYIFNGLNLTSISGWLICLTANQIERIHYKYREKFYFFHFYSQLISGCL